MQLFSCYFNLGIEIFLNIFWVSTLVISSNGEKWQLLIKTDLSCLRELENQIKRLHSYEVPEIIALPIVSGSMSYLAWLGNSLST